MLSKCAGCALNKRKDVQYKNGNSVIYEKGYDVLFIFDMPEDPTAIRLFQNLIERSGIKRYTLMTGLQCRTNNFELPSPVYKIYRQCNVLDEEFASKFKTIVTVGRAIAAITKSDDLLNYEEFYEYLFNQTYFYTPYQWKKSIRVYPLPSLNLFLQKDTFDNFFANKQIKLVQKHIDTFTNYDQIDKNVKFTEIYDTNKFFKEHNADTFAIDTETTGLDHWADDFRIICTTISFDGKHGYFLPQDKINKRVFSAFLKDKKQIYANGKFDCIAFRRAGIQNSKIAEDVNLLHHFLNTVRRRNSIKSLAWLIGYGDYDRDLETFKERNRIRTYADIPKEVLLPYSTLDAIVTYRLHRFGMQLAKAQPTVYDCYKTYAIEPQDALMSMHMEGMLIDREKAAALNGEILNELKILEDRIRKIIGNVNIDSPEQLGKALEKAGYPDLGRTKKNFYQTNEEILQGWKRLGYPVAEDLLKHRSLSKLNAAFVGAPAEKGFFKQDGQDIDVEGILKFIKFDNRVHSYINVCYADSFRSTSFSPNIQQMPKHGDEGKRFRPIFKCPDGYFICEADQAGFQVRIVAHYTQDQAMKDVFLKYGSDFHSITTQGIFARDMTVDEFIAQKKNEPYKSLRHIGKCFTGETEILTSQGPLRIDAFVPEINSGKGSMYAGNVLVIGRDGVVREISATYYGTTSELIKIELENGDMICVTPEHEIPVIRHGMEITVEAQDLMDTDEIMDYI